MWKEFKEFINKGNVMDLAVGVIIGGAFGKIVASLVDNIISPILGLLLGGVQLDKALPITLKAAEMAADGSVATPALVIMLGAFIQSILDFLVIAFVIFLVVKGLNKMKKQEEAAPAAPPAPSASETLLAEIRDLLKK